MGVRVLGGSAPGFHGSPFQRGGLLDDVLPPQAPRPTHPMALYSVCAVKDFELYLAHKLMKNVAD